jgi:hypothetical protein
MSVQIAKDVGAGSVVRNGDTVQVIFTPELLEEYNRRLLGSTTSPTGLPGCSHNWELVGYWDDGADEIFWCTCCGNICNETTGQEDAPSGVPPP